MVWKSFPKAVKSTDLKRFFARSREAAQGGTRNRAELSAKARSQESPASEDLKTWQTGSDFYSMKLTPAAVREMGEMPQD